MFSKTAIERKYEAFPRTSNLPLLVLPLRLIASLDERSPATVIEDLANDILEALATAPPSEISSMLPATETTRKDSLDTPENNLDLAPNSLHHRL